MKQFGYTIVIFSLLYISICADEGNDINNTQKSTDTDSNYTYKVGVDDLIHIDVYDNPDLSGDFTISSDGTISYPLLGQIKIAGYNTMVIKNMITDLLKSDYLYNPIVSVTIREYKSKAVYVLGNVGKPGTYYLDRPTRLFDLLTKADGISDHMGMTLSNQKIHILRKLITRSNDGFKSTKIKTIYVDLYELLVGCEEDANISLREGDVVFVPKLQSIHVIGEVKKTGSFPFEEGMTVLKAISLAGGPTKIASMKNVVIKRIEKNQELKIKVEMGDLVRPDDIIEVPISFW